MEAFKQILFLCFLFKCNVNLEAFHIQKKNTEKYENGERAKCDMDGGLKVEHISK